MIVRYLIKNYDDIMHYSYYTKYLQYNVYIEDSKQKSNKYYRQIE